MALHAQTKRYYESSLICCCYLGWLIWFVSSELSSLCCICCCLKTHLNLNIGSSQTSFASFGYFYCRRWNLVRYHPATSFDASSVMTLSLFAFYFCLCWILRICCFIQFDCLSWIMIILYFCLLLQGNWDSVDQNHWIWNHFQTSIRRCSFSKDVWFQIARQSHSHIPSFLLLDQLYWS